MAFNKEAFIEDLKSMSVLELNELVKTIEEEFGVTAAAPVAMAAGGAAEEAGPTTKTVVLKDPGASKVKVIKAVREITGLGLKEAKEVVDNGGNVKEGIPSEEAEEIKAKLEAEGAVVELV